MTKLLTITLSVLIAVASPVRADETLDAAAKLIKAQHALLDLRARRLTEMNTENEKLEKALIEMKDLNDKNNERQLTYGTIGIVLGLVAGFWLGGHK